MKALLLLGLLGTATLSALIPVPLGASDVMKAGDLLHHNKFFEELDRYRQAILKNFTVDEISAFVGQEKNWDENLKEHEGATGKYYAQKWLTHEKYPHLLGKDDKIAGSIGKTLQGLTNHFIAQVLPLEALPEFPETARHLAKSALSPQDFDKVEKDLYEWGRRSMSGKGEEVGPSKFQELYDQYEKKKLEILERYPLADEQEEVGGQRGAEIARLTKTAAGNFWGRPIPLYDNDAKKWEIVDKKQYQTFKDQVLELDGTVKNKDQITHAQKALRANYEELNLTRKQRDELEKGARQEDLNQSHTSIGSLEDENAEKVLAFDILIEKAHLLGLKPSEDEKALVPEVDGQTLDQEWATFQQRLQEFQDKHAGKNKDDKAEDYDKALQDQHEASLEHFKAEKALKELKEKKDKNPEEIKKAEEDLKAKEQAYKKAQDQLKAITKNKADPNPISANPYQAKMEAELQAAQEWYSKERKKLLEKGKAPENVLKVDEVYRKFMAEKGDLEKSIVEASENPMKAAAELKNARDSLKFIQDHGKKSAEIKRKEGTVGELLSPQPEAQKEAMASKKDIDKIQTELNTEAARLKDLEDKEREATLNKIKKNETEIEHLKDEGADLNQENIKKLKEENQRLIGDAGIPEEEKEEAADAIKDSHSAPVEKDSHLDLSSAHFEPHSAPVELDNADPQQNPHPFEDPKLHLKIVEEKIKQLQKQKNEEVAKEAKKEKKDQSNEEVEKIDQDIKELKAQKIEIIKEMKENRIKKKDLKQHLQANLIKLKSELSVTKDEEKQKEIQEEIKLIEKELANQYKKEEEKGNNNPNTGVQFLHTSQKFNPEKIKIVETHEIKKQKEKIEKLKEALKDLKEGKIGAPHQTEEEWNAPPEGQLAKNHHDLEDAKAKLDLLERIKSEEFKKTELEKASTEDQKFLEEDKDLQEFERQVRRAYFNYSENPERYKKIKERLEAEVAQLEQNITRAHEASTESLKAQREEAAQTLEDAKRNLEEARKALEDYRQSKQYSTKTPEESQLEEGVKNAEHLLKKAEKENLAHKETKKPRVQGFDVESEIKKAQERVKAAEASLKKALEESRQQIHNAFKKFENHVLTRVIIVDLNAANKHFDEKYYREDLRLFGYKVVNQIRLRDDQEFKDKEEIKKDPASKENNSADKPQTPQERAKVENYLTTLKTTISKLTQEADMYQARLDELRKQLPLTCKGNTWKALNAINQEIGTSLEILNKEVPNNLEKFRKEAGVPSKEEISALSRSGQRDLSTLLPAFEEAAIKVGKLQRIFNIWKKFVQDHKGKKKDPLSNAGACTDTALQNAAIIVGTTTTFDLPLPKDEKGKSINLDNKFQMDGIKWILDTNKGSDAAAFNEKRLKRKKKKMTPKKQAN